MEVFFVRKLFNCEFCIVSFCLRSLFGYSCIFSCYWSFLFRFCLCGLLLCRIVFRHGIHVIVQHTVKSGFRLFHVLVHFVVECCLVFSLGLPFLLSSTSSLFAFRLCLSSRRTGTSRRQIDSFGHWAALRFWSLSKSLTYRAFPDSIANV